MVMPLPHEPTTLHNQVPRPRWLRRIVIISAGFLLLILAAIMIPCFVGSRSAANEASAVGSLRTIDTAQLHFSENHPKKSFASSLAELGPPPGADLIDAALVSRTKSGYVFTFKPGSPDPSGPIPHYTVTARPQTFEKTGYRSFFTDESGVIRYTVENRPATATDPPLQ
jgi:type IV pilus assembly protein PilA